jgi:hypothetical protein
LIDMKALFCVVAVALKSKSFLLVGEVPNSLAVLLACYWNVFLRNPLDDKESPPILLGLATLPLGAFYLKNSLLAALDELAAM